jgi:hypothetical protein
MRDTISEKESLEIIGDMITKAKHNLSQGSIFYLLWGWSVLLTCILQYFALTVFTWEFHFIFWPINMTLTGIASGVIGRKYTSSKKYTTFVDNSMKYLWIGFVLLLILILFMGPIIGWKLTYLMVIGLYGFGTFVSGGILKFRPLIIGGLISFAICLIGILARDMITEFSQVLILLGISITVSYLVPGYMLRAKKENYAA